MHEWSWTGSFCQKNLFGATGNTHMGSRWQWCKVGFLSLPTYGTSDGLLTSLASVKAQWMVVIIIMLISRPKFSNFSLPKDHLGELVKSRFLLLCPEVLWTKKYHFNVLARVLEILLQRTCAFLKCFYPLLSLLWGGGGAGGWCRGELPRNICFSRGNSSENLKSSGIGLTSYLSFSWWLSNIFYHNHNEKYILHSNYEHVCVYIFSLCHQVQH